MTKTKGTIFLLYKEDRGACRGVRGTDETTPKVFRDELFQSFVFGFREGVDGAKWRCFSIFQLDLMVVRPVRREASCFGFTENIGELVVFGGKVRQVGRFVIIRKCSGSCHQRWIGFRR